MERGLVGKREGGKRAGDRVVRILVRRVRGLGMGW